MRVFEVDLVLTKRYEEGCTAEKPDGTFRVVALDVPDAVACAIGIARRKRDDKEPFTAVAVRVVTNMHGFSRNALGSLSRASVELAAHG